MLQNSRVTAFTIFELLRENQMGGGGGGVKLPKPPPRLGLKPHISCSLNFNKANKEIHFQRKFEVNMGHY